MIGYVGGWKQRVAAAGEGFYRMKFQSRKLLLLYNFNRFIPALNGQLFLIGQSYNDLHNWEVFPFLGTWCKF